MVSDDIKLQAAKAGQLRSLHLGARAVVFPNVWDVTSARVVEELGYPAIATTSAGIANALGYVDGQNISRDEMLQVVELIVDAVKVPVSADMEAGYAKSSLEMNDTAQALIRAGAVGLNLEDSEEEESRLVDLSLQLEKIKALRQASSDFGVSLVVNARTDAYWWKGADPKTRMRETVQRANAFREAGADCIFVPGLWEIEEIKIFLRESPGPLNVLAVPQSPSIAQLESVGVRRVSIGSGGYRTAMGMMRKLAKEMMEQGTYRPIEEHAIPFAEVNALLRK